jgi:hypothetical protein
MAANKSQEAVERLWEVTRHLSQGANAGPGGIFSIDQDGGRLIVTLMEGEATGRRYSLEVKSHRKVPVDSIIVPAEGAESGGVEDSQGEAGAHTLAEQKAGEEAEKEGQKAQKAPSGGRK